MDVVFPYACSFDLISFVKDHVEKVTPENLCHCLPVIMKRRRRQILKFVLPYIVREKVPGMILQKMLQERWWEGVIQVLDVIPVKFVAEAIRSPHVLNEEVLRKIVTVTQL